jgi:hypothetical protein
VTNGVGAEDGWGCRVTGPAVRSTQVNSGTKIATWGAQGGGGCWLRWESNEET